VDFAERAARNEEIFRSVNRRIEEGMQHHRVPGPAVFHCECDDASCLDTIALAPPEYERVISERYRFILVPGHEDPQIEQVVERYPTYLVVEKIGKARTQLDRDHPQQHHRND
jgi:hypothetical protein